LFMFAMQGANGSGGTAVAPTEIATSSPTPVIEEPSPTPPVDQAVVAPPVQMDGTFTVVVYPNNASEAPPTHIERVNVSDGRVAAQEVVLDATRIVGPNAYINTWRNVTYPTRAVGNVIVAAICVDWQAQCGGMGSADPQARTTLVRSSDGGVTWDVLDT